MNQTDRKNQLIAQGALHRAEIVLARNAVRIGLRPESLARGALQQIAMTAYAAFGKQGGASLPPVRLQTMLPLLLTALSVLAKRKSLLKTLLGSALAAGATAALAAVLSRRKNAKAPGAVGAESDLRGVCQAEPEAVRTQFIA